ncbi:alpha/beta hydrolase [Thiothrix lacustris]|uniref:alpha/beta hydrolase n=1 Tax=Thiothrix lacustris TaxID=525917 RepID=UPI0027E54071|nr:alpha/beta hydrolase [Thiothrix lacustris]WMP16666.1 alpha/beta hydrolase [Thiothrix lacustris]
MKTGFAIIVVFILLTAVGCSTLKSTDVLNFVLPTDGYTLKHATYASGERHDMDIYLPKAATDKPPIVFVFGGAWREGDKADFAFVAQALTGLGYPVIIPNYRLYPQVRFPAFIDDVADAIRYTEVNAQRLLGKPLQRYVLMGHSSGAHTAALLATDTHYVQERGVTARLAGLIALAGPYDLPLDDPEVIPVFPKADPQVVKPVRNVHPGMPPVLLLHGEADTRVRPLHTRRFATALQQAGVPVQVKLYPGVDHVQIIGSLAAPLRLLSPSYDDVQQFLTSIP